MPNKSIVGHFNTLDNDIRYDIVIGQYEYNNIQIKDALDYNPNDEVTITFAEDPAVITVDRQDLTKRIIISQATLRLISNSDLTEELFANTNRSLPIRISKHINNLQEEDVFRGYVDPLQFDQGYAHNWEEIEVTATDPLGGLEQKNIAQLNFPDWDGITPPTITAWNLIDLILEAVDVSSIDDSNLNGRVKNALQTTNINTSVFFGDAEDDRMNLYDVLTEICKYYNLYVSYYNNQAHINDTIIPHPTGRQITSLKPYAMDDSTSISVDDIYKQTMITCDIAPEPETVIGLDDDDYLYSDFERQEIYMQELISTGEGKSAFAGFKDLLKTGTTDYHKDENSMGYTINNFAYVMKNKAWDFGPQGYTGMQGYDQLELLKWLKDHDYKGMLVGYGRGNKINLEDNSIVSSVNLTNYLVISVNGKYITGPQGVQGRQAPLQNLINDPVCRYNGITTAILTPPDEQTTNYIVISGKILLNPLQKLTGPNWGSNHAKLTNTFEGCQAAAMGPTVNYQQLWHHTVPHPDNDDGAYYQQKWMINEGHPGWQGVQGIYGYLDNSKNQDLEYKYSEVGNRTDTISKLPILSCKMWVGDDSATAKYCVERLDLGEQGAGQFEWMTLTEYANVVHYKDDDNNNIYGIEPFFTIGFDPKIGDKIIGTSYSIQNNVNYTMNLEQTGTAIPIKITDQLAGKIHFEIIGPFNAIWQDITRIHPSFWRHTKWKTKDMSLLEQIQSILISNLKIEAVSDNGLISERMTDADNDLVYKSMPDNPNEYINKLEDDIKICTPLTMDECQEYGIRYQISNSYVYNTDNTPFRGFQEVNEGLIYYIKPEECLVDYYNKEYKDPSKIISTCVNPAMLGAQGPLGQRLTHDMMNEMINFDNKNYRLMKYEADLKYKKIDIELREYKTYNNEQINT